MNEHQYEEDPKAQAIIAALSEECRANERGYKQWREAGEQFYELLSGEPCDIQNVTDLQLSAKITLLIIAANATQSRYKRLREITEEIDDFAHHEPGTGCLQSADCICGLGQWRKKLAALDAEVKNG